METIRKLPIQKTLRRVTETSFVVSRLLAPGAGLPAVEISETVALTTPQSLIIAEFPVASENTTPLGRIAGLSDDFFAVAGTKAPVIGHELHATDSFLPSHLPQQESNVPISDYLIPDPHDAIVNANRKLRRMKKQRIFDSRLIRRQLQTSSYHDVRSNQGSYPYSYR